MTNVKIIQSTIAEVAEIHRGLNCNSCSGSLKEHGNGSSLLVCDKCKRYSLKKNNTGSINTSIVLQDGKIVYSTTICFCREILFRFRQRKDRPLCQRWTIEETHGFCRCYVGTRWHRHYHFVDVQRWFDLQVQQFNQAIDRCRKTQANSIEMNEFFLFLNESMLLLLSMGSFLFNAITVVLFSSM